MNTLSTYVKSPWYQNSQNKPPPLPVFLKSAFETIYSTIMDPINWFKYQPNLTSELRKAIPLAKSLPAQGIGVYCQDKSSRFCFASLQITNDKVEAVLSDMVKYKKLQSDQAKPYQAKIKSWYRASKSSLVSIKDDLSSFLVPEVVSTPHLKVLIKTHKPDNGVRLTFSSKGSATQNLSTVLDHVYLKPTVTSDLCSRRLADTREALAFIESVNDYLWTNEIEVRPTIFAVDVKNFFPSMDFSLALPAIRSYLTARGLPKSEVNAVAKGLMVVRNGNFFKWKDQFYNQVSGCALGDPDSCSYCDIGMAYLLDTMIPDCEKALSIPIDPFFKIFRDDGLAFTFGESSIIPHMVDFFNSYNDKIQWTVPYCNTCGLPEATCDHYRELNFLDITITWKQIEKNGKQVWQFQTSSYAKPTDVHAYLHPSSCSSPHLNVSGISVSKTVGTRLRTIHSNDEALLVDLNLFSGYLVSRGYNETTVKFHLANMANRNRGMLITGEYRKASSFIMPLVTQLHPATTVLTPAVKKAFSSATNSDPALQFIIPVSSVVVAYKRLPNLQLLICRNDQNSLVTPPVPQPATGYLNTGCTCLLCKASLFGNYVVSMAMPGYRVRLHGTTTCKSGPGVIYYIKCCSGNPFCTKAHYVGRAWTSDGKVYPMRHRWTVHKSHFRTKFNGCKLTDHLLKFHKGEDPQQFLKVVILEQSSSFDELTQLEIKWTRRLFCYQPTGLNDREETHF